MIYYLTYLITIIKELESKIHMFSVWSKGRTWVTFCRFHSTKTRIRVSFKAIWLYCLITIISHSVVGFSVVDLLSFQYIFLYLIKFTWAHALGCRKGPQPSLNLWKCKKFGTFWRNMDNFQHLSCLPLSQRKTSRKPMKLYRMFFNVM